MMGNTQLPLMGTPRIIQEAEKGLTQPHLCAGRVIKTNSLNSLLRKNSQFLHPRCGVPMVEGQSDGPNRHPCNHSP